MLAGGFGGYHASVITITVIARIVITGAARYWAEMTLALTLVFSYMLCLLPVNRRDLESLVIVVLVRCLCLRIRQPTSFKCTTLAAYILPYILFTDPLYIHQATDSRTYKMPLRVAQHDATRCFGAHKLAVRLARARERRDSGPAARLNASENRPPSNNVLL